MKQVKIAVIGGGASGIMAAISAGKKGALVTVFETTKRIGNKILMTGNGKCNFSNLVLDENSYYCKNAEFIREIMKQFSPKDLKHFFEEAGMLVKNRNGYLYPKGEQASIVLDILRIKLKEYKVIVYTDHKVSKITGQKGDFSVETENGESYRFDKVIISTGGRSYKKTGSDGNGYKLAKKLGHSVCPTVPALVQLCGQDNFYKIIAGVRSEGVAKLYVNNQLMRKEQGEIQFTDYGISGIPVFQFSRTAAYALYHNEQVKVWVDVLPEYEKDELKALVKERITLHKNNTLEEFMCGFANKKLCLMAIKLSDQKPEDKVYTISEDKLVEIVLRLKKITFHITDTKGYDMAQVTAGGIDVSELNNDLSSKITKGLYFTGEIIDVDGICGGYNLQWAFATGYIAGSAAANEQ